MYKAVVFDVGGVLIESPSEGMMAYYCDKLGLTAAQLDEFLTVYEQQLFLGQLSERDLWLEVPKMFDVTLPSDLPKSLWLEGYLHSYKEKPDVVQLVQQLRTQGYKTGLLSNTELPIVPVIEKQFVTYFDTLVFSCVEGEAKPEPKIYEITCKRLGVLPSEAIFIDDREENIRGAEAVGMKGILFESAEQVRDEIVAGQII